MSKFVISSLTVGMAMSTLCGCSTSPECSAVEPFHASSAVPTVRTTSVKSTPTAVKAHAAAVAAKPVHPASPYDVEGFRTFVEDGRLWVFKDGSEDLAKFIAHGEPAKMVVLPGKGPNGMTMKGTDRGVMMEYVLGKPGYRVFVEDGRLWVFEDGSEDLAKFIEHGEPAKMVVLPGKGPNGMTMKGTDRDVMMAYALAKPGFRVFIEDGRLWVFREGSDDLAKFIEHGEPAKIVVRPGKGPNGMTVKSVDGAIIDAYMAAQ